MKQKACLLAGLMLCILSTHAQPEHFRTRKHMSATTIVGISSLTLGVGATIGGLGMELEAGAAYEHNSESPNADAQYNHARNNAVTVRDAGIVLGFAGLGMTIAGAIYDHSKHGSKWSVVAPKKNEIGFAYNF